MSQLTSILIALIVLVASACKSEKKIDEAKPSAIKEIAPIDSSRYIIGDRSMGKIKVGMTKTDILRLYPTAIEDSINLEAEVPCLSVLDIDSTVLFQATYEGSDTIQMLITENVKMKSTTGIKVGSLYSTINTFYPDLIISTGEGYFGISEKGNIMFALEGDIKMDIVNEETMETKLKSVSADTKATMILIK